MQEYSINKHKVIVTDSPQELAEVAVLFTIQKLKTASLLPSFQMLLPWGEEYDKLYKLLIKSYQKGEASFHKVHCFATHEYLEKKENTYAPLCASDERGGQWYLKENFFKEVDVKEKNVFSPSIENIQQAGHYDEIIQKGGGINAAIVSCDEYGSLLWNTPGTSKDRTTHLVEFADNKTAPAGLTAGIKTILDSAEIIFIASGQHKAAVIKRLFYESVSPSLPVTFLREHGKVTFIIDKNAASMLDTLKSMEG